MSRRGTVLVVSGRGVRVVVTRRRRRRKKKRRTGKPLGGGCAVLSWCAGSGAGDPKVT